MRQLCLRLQHRVFCLPAFGHVHAGAHVFNEIAGGVEHRMAYGVKVLDRAVRKNGSVVRLVVRPFSTAL